MNHVMFGLIGMWESVAILAVVLIMFGAKKMPELARGLGEGIREFKKASREVNSELTRPVEATPAPPAAPRQLPKAD
jgi:sec-independent protein translocase protein TatA